MSLRRTGPGVLLLTFLASCAAEETEDPDVEAPAVSEADEDSEDPEGSDSDEDDAEQATDPNDNDSTGDGAGQSEEPAGALPNDGVDSNAPDDDGGSNPAETGDGATSGAPTDGNDGSTSDGPAADGGDPGDAPSDDASSDDPSGSTDSSSTDSGAAADGSSNDGGGNVLPPVASPEGEIDVPAGNPAGSAVVPSEAQLEDTSTPDQIIGDGTKQSCTADAVIEAVAAGGVITFDCGPDPVTITLDRPAKIRNDTGPKIVLDGGGLVTLSGGGQTRILYMNTCDENQVWTTETCQDQDHPQLTVQNLTFVDANSKAESEYDGGGAIWVRGGRFKVVNSRFFRNVCADEGPDVGGGAIRVFSQYQGLPVYVVGSTFGGAAGAGNVCSNGGALSSIGVSWSIYNSLFSFNRAIGNGGNPAAADTPGGGSGGAIYNDGNTMTLSLFGVLIEQNEVNAFGSAIFFVSNDHSGDVVIADSTITNNVGGSWYPTYPQISNHDDTPFEVTNSTIE